MERGSFVDLVETIGRMAGERQVTVLLGNRPGTWAETGQQLAALVAEVGSPFVRASYDPAGIAQAGGSPFYEGLYRGELRRYVQHVDLRDLVASEGRTVSLGSGNGEIMEIISNLRCRTYGGYLCLWPLPGDGSAGFRTAAESFWRILENL
jgi:sugar phosphate isomerase/epimerase